MFDKKISFVIPCYYSQDTIKDVVDDIRKEFPKTDYNIETVLVNDGSKDNTFNVLKSLADEDSRIVAINQSKNFGQDATTMCGLTNATGDYMVVLDDDGQNPEPGSVLGEDREREVPDVEGPEDKIVLGAKRTPQTGDNSRMMLYLSIAGFSASILFAWIIIYVKRNRS